ncbi:hypothetical protein [Agrobacterium sp. CG674]
MLDPNLNPSQVVFDSRWAETFNIYAEGAINVAGWSSWDIPHDLGFKPIVYRWYSPDGNTYSNWADQNRIASLTTTSYIRLFKMGGANTGSGIIRYAIMRNPTDGQ